MDATKKVKSEDDDPPDPGKIKAEKGNFWARYVNGNRNKGIKICHWNIGGGYLCNKMDTIEAILLDHSPHIIGLSEASFWGEHNLDDVRIPNYKVFFANTLNNPSLNISRVAVYVHQDVTVRLREDLMSQDFSSIWLEVGLPRQKKFLISQIYRDWQYVKQETNTSLNISEQFRRWEIFLNQWEAASNEDIEIHVQGDFNLNFLNFSNLETLPNSSQSVRLQSLINSFKTRIIPHGFCQLVEGVTRMWPGTESTLLDHHWTNHPEKVSNVHAFYQGASDHKMILAIRKTKKVVTKPRILKKRSFKNFNPQSFIQAVMKISWLDVYLCEDVDQAVHLLTVKLNKVLDEMAPVRVFQVRTHYAPWMSQSTKEQIVERDLAQKKAAETKSEDDWRIFKQLRNNINNTLKVEKRVWQEQKIKSFGADSSSVWKNLKGWLGWTSGGAPTKLVENGEMFSKPADLAKIMNQYFVRKVKTL